MKDIMKNNKVVTNTEVMRLIRKHYEKDEAGFAEASRYVANTLRESGKDELALYIFAQMGEARTFDTQDIVKPTTDIDEVRKIFEETFTATNEDTADLYDDIWNFFEPYLKGGE